MVGFIDAHRDAHGVEPICDVLPIAPSTYYDHLAKRADPSRLSDRARRDEALRPEIRRVFEDNWSVYGVRKIYGRALGDDTGGAFLTAKPGNSTGGPMDSLVARPEDLVVAFWNGASWVEVAGSVTTGAGGQLVFSVSTDHFTLFSVLHRPGASSTGVFAENLPRSGVALATWGGGTIQQAFTLRTPTGGRLVSIWTFVGGRPVGYAAASPDFANARFRALFPGGVIPAGTPLLLVIE